MEADSLNNKRFEARHIQSLLGIDRNKLFYWMNTHQLVHPEFDKPDGTGTRAVFSFYNLLQLAIIKELKNCGIGLKPIKTIIDALSNYENESGGYCSSFFLKVKENILRNVFSFSTEHASIQFSVRKNKIVLSLREMELLPTSEGWEPSGNFYNIPILNYDENSQNSDYVVSLILFVEIAYDLKNRIEKE